MVLCMFLMAFQCTAIGAAAYHEPGEKAGGILDLPQDVSQGLHDVRGTHEGLYCVLSEAHATLTAS